MGVLASGFSAGTATPLPRYDPLVRTPPAQKTSAGLLLDLALLKPGTRLAVGLSGGADSVALVRALAGRSGELGLVLHAAHLHHGLRGEEADGDLEFCRELAAKLEIPFHEARVDTAPEAQHSGRDLCGIESHPSRKNRNAARVGHPVSLGVGHRALGDRSDTASAGKARESIEEAARRLRYGWFRELLASGEIDAVATAHTLDDQAETVLAKFLRGAWTEGLAGISRVLVFPEGRVVRPLLGTTRAEVEAYLGGLGQEWREDTTNQHLTFTRNRIRHELLPLLEGWNPRLREHLAQMADLAREEESWWQAELARLAPQLLLHGKPMRGGGRAAGGGLDGGLAVEISRLTVLAPAVQRRLLRHAAERFGAALDFAATEALRSLALGGRAGQKLSFASGLHAERTARELQLAVGPVVATKKEAAEIIPEYKVAIPGEIEAPAFGLRLRVDVVATAATAEPGGESKRHGRAGTLRNWKPGDRVRLRHSGGPRKVKEVLERLRVTGTARALWPVLEVEGRIAWMRGVELESEPGLVIRIDSAEDSGANPSGEARIARE